MKKTIGMVLFVVGLVASIVTGYNVYDNTESVKLLGKQITVSQADWTPLIISAAIGIIGLVLFTSSNSKSGRRSRR